VQCPKLQTTDQMVDTAERLLMKAGHVRAKHILGIVAGTRTRTGSTNFMRLHMVGDNEQTTRPEPRTAKKIKPMALKRNAPVVSVAQSQARKMAGVQSAKTNRAQPATAKKARS